jgi:hypothetical protein
MGDVRYRIYLDDKPASKDQLDQIEDITVSQAVETTWEARLMVPICTDDKGNWGGVDDGFLAEFKRLRIELDPGDGKFVALIDGPIVGADRAMSSEPGESTHTVVVMDDSVFLNREESIFVFKKKPPHAVADLIFTGVEQIAETDIERDTQDSTDGQRRIQVERGTEMQVLRKLGKAHGKLAYVLPGKKPGKSIGVFKQLATKKDGLPDLVLLGADRNVATFNATRNHMSPATVEAQTLSVKDKTIKKASMSSRDIDLLGQLPAMKSVAHEAKRIVPPGKDGVADPKASVLAAARKLSYGFKASGSVMGDCYQAVLSPYRVVTVKGVDATQSGDYTIESVDHKLGRSAYEQTFSLIRNAQSEKGGGGLLPKIF